MYVCVVCWQALTLSETFGITFCEFLFDDYYSTSKLSFVSY